MLTYRDALKQCKRVGTAHASSDALRAMYAGLIAPLPRAARWLSRRERRAFSGREAATSYDRNFASLHKSRAVLQRDR